MILKKSANMKAIDDIIANAHFMGLTNGEKMMIAYYKEEEKKRICAVRWRIGTILILIFTLMFILTE